MLPPPAAAALTASADRQLSSPAAPALHASTEPVDTLAAIAAGTPSAAITVDAGAIAAAVVTALQVAVVFGDKQT